MTLSDIEPQVKKVGRVEPRFELIDAISKGIAIFQPVDGGRDFLFIDINNAAARIEGISAEHVIGQRLTELFPGAVKFGLVDVLRRVSQTGQAELLPATLYDNGNETRWRESWVYRLSDGSVAAIYEDVTEREEAQRAFKSVETRYRLLTECSLDGVWDWDLEADSLYLSPRWKEQLGFEDHELPNQFDTWTERLHPSDYLRVLAHLEQFIKKPQTLWSEEFRMQHKDGTYKWTYARGTPLLDDAGEVCRLLGVHIDIDSIKSIESRLSDSEQRLSLALKAAKQGLYDLNVQTGEAIVNAEYATMLGYDPITFEETNQAWLERLHPDDKERVTQTYLDYIDGHIEEYRVEFRQRTSSGDWLWILSLGCLVERDEYGAPLRMLGTHTDISEQKKAQEKIKQAAQVFSSTIEGVTITDPDGTILEVNDAFTQITGYAREEVIGKNPRILQSGRHDSDFYGNMWQELIAKGSWKGEIWNKTKQGVIYPEILTISRIDSSSSEPSGYVAVFTDISDAKKSEERLDYLAHHDPLTGLPNRILFNAILEHAISRAQRNHESLAVLFIDLDRFKNINDTYGHAAGDDLLIQCTQRLKNSIRGEDRIARMGGDEFVAFLEDVGSGDNAARVVQKIINAFKDPFLVNNQKLIVTCSIGVSMYPVDGYDVSSLLRFSDTAMYLAKEDGRNSYQFYSSEMSTAAAESVFLETALRIALKENQFSLVYQPQIDLKSGSLYGLEALIRWNHPDQGVISPDSFIPFAEKVGLIKEIGAWVLTEACMQAAQWKAKGVDYKRIAVNISGRQLSSGHLADFILATIREKGLSFESLELEVTESFLMENEEQSINQLRALHDCGLTIAIDDFGTGYSSLSYLKCLPVDKLKIDRSFVRDTPEDPDDMAITEAVIALGSALGLRVIAEGIETPEQMAFLRERGCQFGQGYYYSRPLRVEEVESMINKHSQS